jgi:hypothetical protein
MVQENFDKYPSKFTVLEKVQFKKRVGQSFYIKADLYLILIIVPVSTVGQSL